jgi:hypothetical protein
MMVAFRAPESTLADVLCDGEAINTDTRVLGERYAEGWEGACAAEHCANRT